MLPSFDHSVIILGDVMLDRFVFGDAERLSPEAPVPVIRAKHDSGRAGGAGNVACNIAALGGRPILITLAGKDAAGDALLGLLPPGGLILRSRARRTTQKLRILAGRQQLVRVDDEEVRGATAAEEAILLRNLTARLADAGALVLSDYGKGVLTASLCIAAIAAARTAGVACIVDPKARDYARYAGADILTPNTAELAMASGLPTETEAEIETAAREMMKHVRVGAFLVTRGDRGMMLVPRRGRTVVAPAMAREVFDVSGAGDTVVAMLALALSARIPMAEALRLANAAAGVVVGKSGTATCSAGELARALGRSEDGITPLMPLENAARLATDWRAQGLRVGFANGCFDVLHAGHARMLREARRHCDRLIVALNSDASITRLKGASRPLNRLSDRAVVVGALASVDAVTSFCQDTPLQAILAIRPDRLFKGTDYRPEGVVGAPEIASWGGQIMLLEMLRGRSTTRLVERVQRKLRRPAAPPPRASL